MRASRARHLVVVEEPARVTDEMGGHVATWTETGRSWASVRPVSARVLERFGRTVGEATHEVRLRERVKVTSKQRLRVPTESLILDVIGVQREPGTAGLVLAREREDHPGA